MAAVDERERKQLKARESDMMRDRGSGGEGGRERARPSVCESAKVQFSHHNRFSTLFFS
jgi:hypothetical protein